MATMLPSTFTVLPLNSSGAFLYANFPTSLADAPEKRQMIAVKTTRRCNELNLKEIPAVPFIKASPFLDQNRGWQNPHGSSARTLP
jgi:hypothetical protein